MKTMTPALLVCLAMMVAAGCTPIPTEYRHPYAQQVLQASPVSATDNALLALVADTRIGATQTLVDPQTGLTSTVTVASEYFSANGRSCRRFSQHYSNAASPHNKLACKADDGWQEIPVASIIE
ncbi:MAG: DVU3141 family protein [Pseudomonadota bacterium]